MKRAKRSVLLTGSFLLALSCSLYGQQELDPILVPDKLSVGLGFGLDHGGFGGNLSFYPIKNVGVFGGAGFALAGAGWNAGLKLRVISKKPESRLNFFALGMYGYNAAILIFNQTELNKLFYGPSVGAGFDFRAPFMNRGYFSLALLVPIRKPEVKSYMDMLEAQYGVEFQSGLFPVTLSAGYRFILL